MNNRYEYRHPLYHDGPFPTSEYAAERPSRHPGRLVKAVVRVEVSRSGGRSWHVVKALKAYLARPEPLPHDPGPGIYAITVRLNLSEVARGMALAKETGRAAFVRRVLEWRYPPGSVESVASATSSPVVSPSQRTVVSQLQWKPKAVPLPVAPASGRRLLTGPEFERLIRSYGYTLTADEMSWRYFLRSDGVIEVCERVSGRVGQRWSNPFR